MIIFLFGLSLLFFSFKNVQTSVNLWLLAIARMLFSRLWFWEDVDNRKRMCSCLFKHTYGSSVKNLFFFRECESVN